MATKYKKVSDLSEQQETLQGTIQKLWESDSPSSPMPATAGQNTPKRSQMTKITGLSPYQAAAREPFYQRKDPTVSLEGLDNPWDAMYSQTSAQMLDTTKNAMVRRSKDLPQTSSFPDVAACLKDPSDPNASLDSVAQRLFSEFVADTDSSTSLTSGVKPWLKDWNAQGLGQPFFPIFVELEVTYYHIPFSKWRIETFTSKDFPQPTIRYIIGENITPGNMTDVRTISGRVPVLPQESFSLISLISKLISDQLG